MFKVFLLSPFIICVLFALFAPFISSHSVSLNELANAKIPPNLSYLFGTDLLGNDLFTQIAYALRISFFVGIMAAFLSVVLAIIYTLLARCFFMIFL